MTHDSLTSGECVECVAFAGKVMENSTVGACQVALYHLEHNTVFSYLLLIFGFLSRVIWQTLLSEATSSKVEVKFQFLWM